MATNDSHYLNHEDADLHDTLLCIGTKTFKSAQRRMRFSTDQFFAKTPEEMAAVFREHPEVLERTLEIAARIDLYPITRKPVTPQFPVPSGHTLESYFLEVARSRFEERIQECQPLWQRGVLKYTEDKYRARLEFELDTVLSMGFPGYFLLVWDFIRKAREMGVPVGPGRGSAAGSIVAWSMHITDIDPMQYDLLFERFLNPERISMPDVDIDFCRDGRQKVIDYVTETYGKDRVSNIVTINQLKTKAVIKDVARVFEKDFAFANNLTKLVPQEPGKPITVDQALEQSEKLRELYESDPEVKNILDISARLEGLARNTGVHAAGVIIAPDDLTKFAPLSRDKDGKVMVQDLHSPGALLYNDNQITGGASVPAGKTFTLNGTTYTSSATNPVTGNGSVTMNKEAPKLTVGWGNLLPRNGRHFTVRWNSGLLTSVIRRLLSILPAPRATPTPARSTAATFLRIR